MRAKRRPAESMGETAGQKRKNTYRHPQFTTTENECNLESEIKSYMVDLLAERLYQGADRLQHRHAALYWERFGGGFKHV